MIKTYFKIAFRNLLRQKGYAAINIFGLTTGMAVAMLIGLWLYDELTFDQRHENYDRIAQVMHHRTMNGEIVSMQAVSMPVGEELEKTYGSDFERVVMSSWTNRFNLAYGETKVIRMGNFMSPSAPDLFSLRMLSGTRSGLTELNSVLLSSSLAKALFGEVDPLNKVIKVNNKLDVKVTGVFEDFPHNSTQFRDIKFILPWELFVTTSEWVKKSRENREWADNSFQIFVQLTANADVERVSEKIRYIKRGKTDADEALSKPEISLHPMSRWHLYSEWKNGKSDGGRIQFVWLFGAIGLFVLLLACINFMNLSTARSEKRAKEVGIRKAVGSLRGQLITQFFMESLLVSLIAFVLAVISVQLSLSFFNEIADKQMSMLWSNPYFWLMGLGFTLITGIVAGSYPALYLSSFQPLATLKGTFKAGRFAAIPRKVLVVTQFTVSIILIIGTIVVYKQILFAKNRPIGYNRNGLVSIHLTTKDIHKHFEAVKDELLRTGAVVNMAESVSPTYDVWSNNIGFSWKGKDPSFQADFATIGVSHDFGSTVGWKFKEGRDFSKDFSTDSSGFVLNETAVKFMGLKNPVGELIKWEDKTFKVIGVVKDMLMSSPFDPVKQTIYFIAPRGGNFVTVRVNPDAGIDESLKNIESVFKKYDPSSAFNYDFVDDEHAYKFAAEERIGKLAAFFATLAIFISCLGLSGLASFVAEQRTKEIGVRKVLGASVFNLWKLLSKDFVVLVLISLLIAIPVAWYYMNGWLQKYIYHTNISWWIFVATGAGALAITLLTVSYQSIKAALMNPVKTLKSE